MACSAASRAGSGRRRPAQTPARLVTVRADPTPAAARTATVRGPVTTVATTVAASGSATRPGATRAAASRCRADASVPTACRVRSMRTSGAVPKIRTGRGPGHHAGPLPAAWSAHPVRVRRGIQAPQSGGGGGGNGGGIAVTIPSPTVPGQPGEPTPVQVGGGGHESPATGEPPPVDMPPVIGLRAGRGATAPGRHPGRKAVRRPKPERADARPRPGTEPGPGAATGQRRKRHRSTRFV